MSFLSAFNLGGTNYKLKAGNIYDGTQEQWNALTQEQQDEYDYVITTGDEQEVDPVYAYLTTDSAVSTIAQGDYFPVQKTDGTKRKVLWNTIVSKIKSALGSAAEKNSTNAVTSGSTDLVESGAVYSEIQTVKNRFSVGTFYIATTANTTIRVTADNIISGTLPPYAGSCIYQIVSASSTNSPAFIFADSSSLYIHDTGANIRRKVFWVYFN